MPKHISDYSLEALERELDQEIDVGGSDETIMVRRSDNEYISDYNRDDLAVAGYTIIRYSRRMRASSHLKFGVMSFGLFLPFSLAADAAMRMGMGNHTLYFHSGNGDELGTSKGAAIARANDVGEKLMRKGEYEEASRYFNIAYYLCSDSRERGFREKRDEAAEKAAEWERAENERRGREASERQRREREARKRERREREARERREQEARERQSREREARERERREREASERREQEARERQRREREATERERKEQEARERREQEARERQRREREAREREARERERREQEARERQRREREARERERREVEARERREVEARERREVEARERERREQEAREVYQQAQELWTEAFSCEKSNLAAIAKQKFERCHELFSVATTLMPNVVLYENWNHISSLKLEGDSLFYEAVSLQEQGNLLRRRQKYEEAFAKYKEALHKYKRGFQLSRDTRFVACIEFVNCCIREVDEIIQEGFLEERLSRIQIETSRNEIDAVENANEELIYNQILDS